MGKKVEINIVDGVKLGEAIKGKIKDEQGTKDKFKIFFNRDSKDKNIFPKGVQYFLRIFRGNDGRKYKDHKIINRETGKITHEEKGERIFNMKKVNIKNSRGLNLVGDLYTVDSDKLVVMSHGFNYDRHEKNEKFSKIAKRLSEAGYNALPFDFSGSGESDDSPLTIANYTDDLKSVIKWAKDKGYKDVILFGASLGGLVSFLAYDKNIKAIVGLAPSTDKAESDWRDKHFSQEELKKFEEKGQINYASKGIRDYIVIDKQYIEERENLNQKKVLENINCPVLLFHSDDDKFVPMSVSENAVEIIGNKAELYFTKSAGHAFLNHIDEVCDKMIKWLEEKI